MRIHLDVRASAAGAPPAGPHVAVAAAPAASPPELRPSAIREVARETSRVHEVAPAFYLVALLAGCAALLGVRVATAGLPAEHRIGVTFAALFAWVLGFVLTAVVARRLRRRRAAASPRGEAWRCERNWAVHGISDDVATKGWRLLGIVACMALVLAPFHMLAPLVEGEGGVWVLYLVLVMFDLALIVAIGIALRILGRRLRYGENRIRLDALPARTGDRLGVTFEAARTLRSRTDLRADLLCIREITRVGSDGGESARRVHEVLYEHALRFATDVTGHARLSFQLPADSPATSLLNAPHVYWELVVTTISPHDDYEGVFLLPVYSLDT